MALGSRPRFELSKAYWIVAGIGGGDPGRRIGWVAVWANHVLMATWRLKIDARQIQKAGRLVIYHYRKEVPTRRGQRLLW